MLITSVTKSGNVNAMMEADGHPHGAMRGGGKGLLREQPSSPETWERVLVQSAYTQRGPPAPRSCCPQPQGHPGARGASSAISSAQASFVRGGPTGGVRSAPRRRHLGWVGAELTSSPFWILRLELMMILWPRSKVTTSATQLGAHEWLMYLRAAVQRWLAIQQPGRADTPTPTAPPHRPAHSPLAHGHGWLRSCRTSAPRPAREFPNVWGNVKNSGRD